MSQREQVIALLREMRRSVERHEVMPDDWIRHLDGAPGAICMEVESRLIDTFWRLYGAESDPRAVYQQEGDRYMLRILDTAIADAERALGERDVQS